MGSEMCIRDRYPFQCQVAPLPLILEPFKIKARALQAADMEVHKAHAGAFKTSEVRGGKKNGVSGWRRRFLFFNSFGREHTPIKGIILLWHVFC